MAFIQFASEDASLEAIRLQNVPIRERTLRITPSKITIEVIPPTDAVFGKPMTVGRHVMAVNPSILSADRSKRREEAMKAVDLAAADVVRQISERLGVDISTSDHSAD